MSEIKYHYNENIKALEVDPKFIQEGLTHALQQGYIAIRIYELNHRSRVPIDLDLAPFAGDKTIVSLSISDSFKLGKISLEGLYEMQALKKLAWQDKKIQPELQQLPRLEMLFATWSKGLSGFSSLKKLKHLLLTSLTESDCSVLEDLCALEELRLTAGTVESLHGIDNLSHLCSINLNHCTKLVDATALASLKSLTKLYVEKCKYLHDFTFLADAPKLEEIFVSELDSIAFVPTLKHLRILKFWNLADGNVAPALDAPALTNVDMYPNRKHYTHTKTEINALLVR